MVIQQCGELKIGIQEKTREMEQHTLKSVKNNLNTIIYSYLETSGGQSCSLYLNAVHFFNTSVNQTSAAAYDTCFLALVSNMFYSIKIIEF